MLIATCKRSLWWSGLGTNLLAFALLSSVTCLALGQNKQPLTDKENRLKDLTGQWTKPVDCLWNFHNLYNPKVVHVPQSDYPFKMWFFGWSVKDYNIGLAKSDAIFHARSRDLKDWEVYSGPQGWDKTMNPKLWVPVICAGSQPLFDSEANGDPSVVLKDGKYYMAFSSVGFDIKKEKTGDHIFLVNNVMGATSDDGIHWKKTPRPIAIWDQEYINRWELHPDKEVSPPPADYYGGYHRPSIMYDNGKWKLWFDYFHPGTFVSLGYAENTGDFCAAKDWKILRAGKEPLLKDWPNPDVIKAGDMYYAFSDPPYYPEEMGVDTRQLTMASSRDGLNWTILGHIRPEGLASSHVPQALLLREGDDSMLYLFYSWKPAYNGKDKRDYRYKKIRYIKRKLAKDEM